MPRLSLPYRTLASVSPFMAVSFFVWLGRLVPAQLRPGNGLRAVDAGLQTYGNRLKTGASSRDEP